MKSMLIQRLRSKPLTAFTIVAGALAVVLPYVAPGVTWLPFACFLGASAVLLTRLGTKEPRVAAIVAAAFGLRFVLAGALFVVSSLDLPILQSLHREYGLWEFGGDGHGFHVQALQILDAWRAGIDLQTLFVGNYEYKGLGLLVAMVYAVVGDSPFHYILVNVWLGSLTGLLAYMLAVRLSDKRRALVAAAVVAFWPSSILWSTQLLKDPIQLVLVLSALTLLVSLWQRPWSLGAGTLRSRTAEAIQWLSLVAAVFGTAYLRNYIGMVLVAAVGIGMSLAFCRALWRRRAAEAIVACAMTALVAVGAVLGTSIDLYAVFSPLHPEVGHVRRGDTFRQQHQLVDAAASYRRAMTLNPQYAPAYRGLGLTLLEMGDRTAAEAALASYVERESDPRLRAEVSAIESELRASREAARQAGQAAAAEAAAKQAAAAAIQEAATGATGLSSPPVPAPQPRSPSPPSSPDTVPSVQPPAALHVPPPIGRLEATRRRIVERSTAAVTAMTAIISAERLGALRQAQVSAGGASLIDSDVDFRSFWDVIAYTPRALAIAYLSPLPGQWWYTTGASGMMRPASSIEVVSILAFVPFILVGLWRTLTSFRPEAWVLVLFIGALAVAMGLMMPNVGTIFRLRLQFLIPSLILAATALPSFVYRILDRFTPPSEAPAGGAPISAVV